MAIKTFIEELGGATAVGRELGIPMTTVAAWTRRDKVPHWRLPALINFALRKKIPVPTDLAA